MTRHLIRLIWNRRRSNLLIMIEILCAFLVVEAVALTAVHYANNYRQPLGFSIDRVWQIDMETPRLGDDPAARAAQVATIRQLASALRDLPEIESTCSAFLAPYESGGWTSGHDIKGRTIEFGVNVVSDTCGHVLGVTMIAGRWFSNEDEGVSWRPVLLNQQLAREMYGDADPVGTFIPVEPNPEEEKERVRRGLPPEPQMRVVGVIQDFRQHGEYATPWNYLMRRVDLSATEGFLPRTFLVKLRPGTGAAFEETLARRLHEVAREWSFEITPLTTARDRTLAKSTTPLTAAAVVAGFLLLMVALGLTGVVWQNVTQRIREIGLRRAKGARIENIHRQILGELVVMTSMALLIGGLLLAQVPLFPLPEGLREVPAPVFVTATIVSVLAIYLLTIACGWYPARLATAIQPAEALHYE